MASKPRVSALRRANETDYCSIPGCHEHRYSLSKWCQRHLSTYQRNGDPLGLPVRPQQWKHYRAKVEALLASNGDHQGLAHAVRFVQQWMNQADQLDREVGLKAPMAWAAEVARLKRAGVSPLQVISELAAAWSYLEDHPRVCRSDSHRTFTLSKAILSMAPRPRKVTALSNLNGTNGYALKAKPAALKHISSYLVESLAPLLVNIHQNIQDEKQAAQQAVALLREPFKAVPTHAFKEAAKKAASNTHK